MRYPYQPTEERVHSGHRFRNPAGGRVGFTRLDLLVVVGIFVGLMAIQLPTWGNRAIIARQSSCVDQIRQLTRAWQMYAADHHGDIPAAGRHNSLDQPPDWTTGSADEYTASGEWLDLPTTSEAEINPELSIVDHNKLWPYVQETHLFRCPADRSYGSHPEFQDGAPSPRVRSYSMNAWLGGPAWGASGAGWKVHKTMDSILTPATRFVFLDEREDSINDGYFIVDMTGWDDQPVKAKIVDYPMFWHDNGANLSFADGHVEFWRWKDSRTIPKWERQQEMMLNIPSPNNPDVERLQSVATRRTD